MKKQSDVVKLQMNTIECRKLSLQDDLKQVGRLIYYTDDYVFPYVYETPEIGACVHAEMVKRNTIYNYRNITVALIDGMIAGIVVMKKAPIVISEQEMISSFDAVGAVHDERFNRVYDEYWRLLQDEPDGFYIANVCVDQRFRRQGVARTLLNSLLDNSETYNLETVVANENAFKLYQSLGFVIKYQYAGFTGVPCYRMHRLPKI